MVALCLLKVTPSANPTGITALIVLRLLVKVLDRTGVDNKVVVIGKRVGVRLRIVSSTAT